VTKSRRGVDAYDNLSVNVVGASVLLAGVVLISLSFDGESRLIPYTCIRTEHPD
jgi:hypothetical protein